eukprot:GHVL01016812.1.p2 GENE.GHVL01016812.1~~GHVL01016812.1.p2  ORF type:complete len:486 (-),score=126.10 GHVL01016812.1:3153-4610(-)
MSDWQVQDWEYIAEGNQNIICRYIGQNPIFCDKVLRLRKVFSSPIRPSSNLYKQPLFSLILGQNILTDGLMIKLPKSFIRKLYNILYNNKNNNKKTRRESSFDWADESSKKLTISRIASLIENCLVPPPQIRMLTADGLFFTIEIKPKCGVKLTNNILQNIKYINKPNRYLMMQCYKMMNNHITHISPYNPENLFNKNILYVKKEIKHLIDNCNNNFRIFNENGIELSTSCFTNDVRHSISRLAAICILNSKFLQKIYFIQRWAAGLEDVANELLNIITKDINKCDIFLFQNKHRHNNCSSLHKNNFENFLHCWECSYWSIREWLETNNSETLKNPTSDNKTVTTSDYETVDFYDYETEARALVKRLKNGEEVAAQTASWLRRYLLGRTVMDMSLILNILIAPGDPYPSPPPGFSEIDKNFKFITPQIQNILKSRPLSLGSQNNSREVVFYRLTGIDLDAKPCSRIPAYAKQIKEIEDAFSRLNC